MRTTPVTRTALLDPGPGTTDAVTKLRRIQTLTDTTLARLDLDNLLDALLERVRDLLGADTAAILLLDETSRDLVATAAKGIEAEVRQGVRIPYEVGFAGRVAAERRPILLDRVDESTVINPILIEKGIRSLLGVPLLANGTTLGVLHVGTLGSRTFTGDDAELLQLAGDRAAVAISAAISKEQRLAARALQWSLAPYRLPRIDGLELASRYVPGLRGEVGGDWFDMFALRGGGVAVAIGDAAGHGLHSAVVMGRLRTALRAYALEYQEPAEVLEHLDAMVCHFDPDTMATVLFGILDARAEHLTFATAGHPVPVIAAPGGRTSPVVAAVDPPIGVPMGGSRRQTRVLVPHGATLYLYTDGLVERRGGDIDEGIQRLCAAASCGAPDAGCARIMSALVGDAEPADDIALLGIRAAT